LVRDHSWQQIETPIPEDKFSVSLESGPYARSKSVKTIVDNEAQAVPERILNRSGAVVGYKIKRHAAVHR
jgi:hypothetical protein